MSIDNMLNKTALIERETVTYSGSADPSSQWSTVGSDVPCAVEPLSGSFRFTPGGPVCHCSHRAYFNSDVDMQTGDRITIEDTVYSVAFVADACGRGNHLEVTLS